MLLPGTGNMAGATTMWPCSTCTRSCMITASASSGTTAPVMMRMAVPVARVPWNGWPAADTPVTASRTGVAGLAGRSAVRSA